MSYVQCPHSGTFIPGKEPGYIIFCECGKQLTLRAHGGSQGGAVLYKPGAFIPRHKALSIATSRHFGDSATIEDASMKDPAPFDQLNGAQREALRHFSQANGRTWREILLKMWERGTDDGRPLLRQIRNNIGPSGLLAITAEQLNAAESPAEKELRRADERLSLAQEGLRAAERELADAQQEQTQAADQWQKLKMNARA